MPTVVGYTSTEELQRILKLRTVSDEQQAALVRVLTSAQVEIDAEIDLADDADALTPEQLQLAAEVQLERATEHWQQGESPFGILGIGDTGATYIARDSWDRHALKLQPLKNQWGLA